MTAKSIAILISLAALAAPSVAFANTDNDEVTINGRSEMLIESTLRQNGVPVTSVEQWGQYVRAFVPQADGTTSMQFFDANTLAPVSFTN